MCQRGYPGEVLVLHLVAVSAELLDDAADMDGVPDQHGVGEQAEAAGLIHYLLVVAGPEAALVGEEQRFGQDVAELAAVELQLDGVAIDYGERYRAGKPISTSRAEGTVNQLVNARMNKRRQMRWSPRGAHRVLQVRATVLDRRLGHQAIQLAA